MERDILNEVLLEQLREQMNNLAAAVQLVSPVVREKGGEQYEPYLAILHQSMYRLLRLLGNMEYLELSESGRLSVREETLDLAGLCRQLASQAAPLTEQAGVAFSYEEEKGSLITRGDGLLLRRMLLGLIANAVHAAGKGGRAGLRLTVRESRAVITVWDNGGGISGQDGKGAGLLDRPAGPGLGLRVARSIAAAHGGAIVLQQQEDRGARAVVSLPVRPPENDGLLRTPAAAVDRSGGFSDLLVELAGELPYQAFPPQDLY